MKVVLISDESVCEYQKKVNDIKSKLETKKINISLKYSKNSVYDMVVIFSDNLEYITNHINLKNSKTLYVIMTQNLTSEYIINCVKLTPYVGFSKNTTEYIIQKLLNIYNKANITLK